MAYVPPPPPTEFTNVAPNSPDYVSVCQKNNRYSLEQVCFQITQESYQKQLAAQEEKEKKEEEAWQKWWNDNWWIVIPIAVLVMLAIAGLNS